MKVKVKGAGVKIAGKWYFVNQTAEIAQEEYEANKEYLVVIEDEKVVLKGKKRNQTSEGD